MISWTCKYEESKDSFRADLHGHNYQAHFTLVIHACCKADLMFAHIQSLLCSYITQT